MNASYFLNAPYSLNPQNPRVLARVQASPPLKDIEVGGCVCTQATKPTVYQTNLRGPLLVTS